MYEGSSPGTLTRRGRELVEAGDQQALDARVSKDGIRCNEVVIIGEQASILPKRLCGNKSQLLIEENDSMDPYQRFKLDDLMHVINPNVIGIETSSGNPFKPTDRVVYVSHSPRRYAAIRSRPAIDAEVLPSRSPVAHRDSPTLSPATKKLKLPKSTRHLSNSQMALPSIFRSTKAKPQQTFLQHQFPDLLNKVV